MTRTSSGQRRANPTKTVNKPRRLLRTALLLFAGATVLSAAVLAVMLWNNNHGPGEFDRAELQSRFDAAVGWCIDNRDRILQSRNELLWWMLLETGRLTGDPRLTQLVADYDELRRRRGTTVWTPLFEPSNILSAPPFHELLRIPDYNVLYVYALTCDTQLGREPLVVRQLEPDYCGLDVMQPRCVTHQLFGVRLMQEWRCGNPQQLEELANVLQERIVTALGRDPRVGDAYLQRVALLLESGASERINPAWIRRLMDAQNDDGGWDDVHPLLGLPGGRALGLTSVGLHAGRTASTFHASAQGVWVLGQLLALDGRSGTDAP